MNMSKITDTVKIICYDCLILASALESGTTDVNLTDWSGFPIRYQV